MDGDVSSSLANPLGLHADELENVRQLTKSDAQYLETGRIALRKQEEALNMDLDQDVVPYVWNCGRAFESAVWEGQTVRFELSEPPPANLHPAKIAGLTPRYIVSVPVFHYVARKLNQRRKVLHDEELRFAEGRECMWRNAFPGCQPTPCLGGMMDFESFEREICRDMGFPYHRPADTIVYWMLLRCAENSHAVKVCFDRPDQLYPECARDESSRSQEQTWAMNDMCCHDSQGWARMQLFRWRGEQLEAKSLNRGDYTIAVCC